MSLADRARRLIRWLTEPPSLEALHARWGALRYAWVALAVVTVGVVASVLTSTIVNVALPDLSNDFGIGAERAQWVASAHMASTTVTMLVLPWALARFGFRRVYFLAIQMLFLGGLFGGFAWNFDMLIGMRVVQGAAAGLLQPLAAVLIMRRFPSDDQGRALGLFSFGVVLTPAAGPAVGGLLVDAFGWRAVFFISIPFAILGMLLAARLLPKTPVAAPDRPFDWLGFGLVAAFVVLMLEGLVRLHDFGLVSRGTLLWAVAMAGLGFLFILWERRCKEPLVDLHVFRTPAFRIGCVVAFTYGMGLFGSTLLVPTFVQGVMAYNATDAGSLMVPSGLALALTLPIAGRLSDWIEPRLLVAGGLLLFALSFALIVWQPAVQFWPLVWILVLGRIGLGLVLPALSLGAMQPVPLSQASNASSVFSFARLLGGAVGTGALPVYVEWRALAGGATSSLNGGLAAQPAYREGFAVVMAVCLLAALVAWGIRTPRKQRS